MSGIFQLFRTPEAQMNTSQVSRMVSVVPSGEARTAVMCHLELPSSHRASVTLVLKTMGFRKPKTRHIRSR